MACRQCERYQRFKNGHLDGIASLPKRRKLLQTTCRYTALDYEEVGASVGPMVIQKGEVEGGEGGSGGGKPLVRSWCEAIGAGSRTGQRAKIAS